jgi:hypothetical protein
VLEDVRRKVAQLDSAIAHERLERLRDIRQAREETRLAKLAQLAAETRANNVEASLETWQALGNSRENEITRLRNELLLARQVPVASAVTPVQISQAEPEPQRDDSEKRFALLELD